MNPQQPTPHNQFNRNDKHIHDNNFDNTQTSSTAVDPTDLRRHNVSVHPGTTDIADSQQAVLHNTDKPLPADPSVNQDSFTYGIFTHGKGSNPSAYNSQYASNKNNNKDSQSGIIDSTEIDPLSTDTSESDISSSAATHGSIDTTTPFAAPSNTCTTRNTTIPTDHTNSAANTDYKADNYNNDNYKTGNDTTGNYNTDNYKTDNYKADNYNTDNCKTDNYKTDNNNTNTNTNTNTNDRPSAAKGIRDTIAGTVQKIAGSISGNPDRRATGETRVRDGKEQITAAKESKKSGIQSTTGHGRGDLEGTYANDQYGDFKANTTADTTTTTTGDNYNPQQRGYGRGDLGGAEAGTEPVSSTTNTTSADYTTPQGHGRGDLEGIDAKEQ